MMESTPPRRITSKNVPKPIQQQQLSSSQQPLQVVAVDPTQPQPLPEPAALPVPTSTRAPTIVTKSAVNNTITWSAVIDNKTIYAGDENTTTSDATKDLVAIKADEWQDGKKLLDIQAEGVYFIQAFAKDQTIEIEGQLSKGHSFIPIAKRLSFVNTTCYLKKGDLISISIVPSSVREMVVLSNMVPQTFRSSVNVPVTTTQHQKEQIEGCISLTKITN